MKRKLLTSMLWLAGSLFLLCCNRSVLNSLTTIQSGKQFELGGNRHGAFTARLENIGDVPVTISERLIDGQHIARGVFQPGDKQTVRFPAGSAVSFNNSSTHSAQLHLVVTGDRNLSMRERSN